MLGISRSLLNTAFEGYKLTQQSIVDSNHEQVSEVPNAQVNQVPCSTHQLPFKQYRHLILHNHLHTFQYQNTRVLFVINQEYQVHCFIVGNLYQFTTRSAFDFPATVRDFSHVRNNASVFLLKDMLLCSDGCGRLYVNSFSLSALTAECTPLLDQPYVEQNSLLEYVTRNRSFEASEDQFHSGYLPSVIIGASLRNNELFVVLQSSLDFQNINEAKKTKRVEFYYNVVKFKTNPVSHLLQYDSSFIIYGSDAVKTCFFSEDGCWVVMVGTGPFTKHGDEQGIVDEPEEAVSQESIENANRALDQYTATLDDFVTESDPEELHIIQLNCTTQELQRLYASDTKTVATAQNSFLGVPYDVDICIFAYSESAFKHVYTLHAMSYILNGKPQKKFVSFSDRYTAIVENKRIFLYNHSAIDPRTHRGLHQIVDVEEDEIVTGIQFTETALFVLTQYDLLCYTYQ